MAKERELRGQLEQLRAELAPIEAECEKMMASSTRRTTIVSWCLLAYMCAQGGFFGRLTFVNYSWDLMEPITYFVTYSTSILCFAYFVLTRQVCQVIKTGLTSMYYYYIRTMCIQTGMIDKS